MRALTLCRMYQENVRKRVRIVKNLRDDTNDRIRDIQAAPLAASANCRAPMVKRGKRVGERNMERFGREGGNVFDSLAVVLRPGGHVTLADNDRGSDTIRRWRDNC